MTLIIILLVAAAATFAYLVYRVGWAEAFAVTGTLFAAIGAAMWQFADAFKDAPLGG